MPRRIAAVESWSARISPFRAIATFSPWAIPPTSWAPTADPCLAPPQSPKRKAPMLRRASPPNSRAGSRRRFAIAILAHWRRSAGRARWSRWAPAAHRLHSLAHLVGGAHLLSDRFPQPAVRRPELGLELFHLPARHASYHRSVGLAP